MFDKHDISYYHVLMWIIILALAMYTSPAIAEFLVLLMFVCEFTKRE